MDPVNSEHKKSASGYRTQEQSGKQHETAAKVPSPNPEGANEIAEWTIMVYISADDVLANFAVESLRRLKNKANERVVVAAQFGFDAGNGSQEFRRYIFNHETEIAQALAHNLVARTNDIPKNLTTTGILTNFVDFAFKQCKAEHYALILWGHGPELLFQLPSPDEN